MSVLSYICDYGSESETSDCDIELSTSRTKLPAPDLSRVPVAISETHVDDPELHGGRIRSFSHVRGNWATLVYIKYTADTLQRLTEKLEKELLNHNKSWQKCENVHISLSKTVVLNYHLITPFTKLLQKAVTEFESFELGFDGVKVYCNEENTRTFIALQVDYFSQRYFLQLTTKVDEILTEFKLPTFYEDPSFHMSIFWINGNYKSEASNIIKELDAIVKCEVGKSLTTVVIDCINCKSGNKHFQYYF